MSGKSFRVGSKVTYLTHKGSSGAGKIVAIHETGRGLWYEVLDGMSKRPVRVRAAGLSFL